MTPTSKTELELGRDAYERHRWEETLAHLTAADEQGELAAEDLVALAHGAYWSGDLDHYLAVLERAYVAFLERGEMRDAAHTALMLQWDYQAKPAPALASGWFRRAERILESCPECVAHGYLAQARLWDALAGGRQDRALRHAREIAAVAGRVGDRSLGVLGTLREGQVLIAGGDAGGGLACLDEAVVAATAGELDAMTTAVVYCGAIASCRDLGDWERIGQWAGVAMRWCERERCKGFPGMCRIYTAELTSMHGEWDRALAELQRASDELRRFGAPGMAAAALYELGEIRRRKGDFGGARAAYSDAYAHGLEPQPGLALLWLAEGDAASAGNALERALRRPPSKSPAGGPPGEPNVSPGGGGLGRTSLLAAQVEVAHARADRDAAAAAARELEGIAATFGTKALLAVAAQARATVALEASELEDALRSAGRARALWHELKIPYETAKAHLTTAAAHDARGDSRSAQLELRAGREIVDRLGAAVRPVEVAARCESLAPAEPGAPSAHPTLTARELDVLRLAAEGLTDAQIAERLILSPHTVHRHVSNIRAKTGQPSRTAAVAQAARAGMI